MKNIFDILNKKYYKQEISDKTLHQIQQDVEDYISKYIKFAEPSFSIINSNNTIILKPKNLQIALLLYNGILIDGISTQYEDDNYFYTFDMDKGLKISQKQKIDRISILASIRND